jgi:hypothetical protein
VDRKLPWIRPFSYNPNIRLYVSDGNNVDIGRRFDPTRYLYVNELVPSSFLYVVICKCVQLVSWMPEEISINFSL